MAWKHYLEVDCEQTFQFLNTSIMEYLRLLFHFVYRDRSNADNAQYEDIFDGFMQHYSGLLHGAEDRLTDAGADDPTHKNTLNFANRNEVHDSVFATSVNAVSNPRFDGIMGGMNTTRSQTFRYAGTYSNDDITLFPAQGLCKALQVVAGEVLRSSTLIILTCDEYLVTTPNDVVAATSRDLKKLIQTVKIMECNRKFYYTPVQRNATDPIVQIVANGKLAWFYYIELFFVQIGLSTAQVPTGSTRHSYVTTLTDMLDRIEQNVVPLFQSLTEDGEQLKPYFCTQQYMEFWSHLVLTHYEQDSNEVERLKTYCLRYNTAAQLNDHRISQATQERDVRQDWNHRMGNFRYEERRRKDFWDQNRALRRDGRMLYVYSQRTRQPHLYTHRADVHAGQVPLYYRPTRASGYGDLSEHGPDHEFWRQGTRNERRAAAAARDEDRGAGNRPAGVARPHGGAPPSTVPAAAQHARAHGGPPRNPPHTGEAPAAPNQVPDGPKGTRPAAAGGGTVPNSHKNMSKSAKAALKTHDAKEAASNPTRALTREEQAGA